MKFTLSFILALISVAALSYGSYIYFEGRSLALRSQAVDGCMQASLYRTNFTTTDGSAITTESPIETEVKKCLDLKNVAGK